MCARPQKGRSVRRAPGKRRKDPAALPRLTCGGGVLVSTWAPGNSAERRRGANLGPAGCCSALRRPQNPSSPTGRSEGAAPRTARPAPRVPRPPRSPAQCLGAPQPPAGPRSAPAPCPALPRGLRGRLPWPLGLRRLGGSGLQSPPQRPQPPLFSGSGSDVTAGAEWGGVGWGRWSAHAAGGAIAAPACPALRATPARPKPRGAAQRLAARALGLTPWRSGCL